MKRFTKKKDGEFIPTKTVLFTFDKEPSVKLKFGYLSVNLKPYISPPIRCYGCNRWGHGISNCRSKRRCLRCGLDHEVKDCTMDKSVPLKCLNCDGAHSAAYAGCPAAKKVITRTEAQGQPPNNSALPS